jgi:hypothetical protein
MLYPEGLDSAAAELLRLRTRRREVVNRLTSLKAFGYESIAREDQELVNSLDRQIRSLRVKPDDDP